MTPVRPLAALALGVALAGCAAARAAGPPDFPFRATDQRPFVLAWRLEEAPREIRAVGLLDVDGYVDRLQDATVELVGLDAGGRLVSRAADRVSPRAFAGDRAWPFRMSLRPTGRETRFVVRLAAFDWKVEPFGGR